MESQSVFQAEIQAKKFLFNWVPVAEQEPPPGANKVLPAEEDRVPPEGLLRRLELVRRHVDLRQSHIHLDKRGMINFNISVSPKNIIWEYVPPDIMLIYVFLGNYQDVSCTGIG